MSHVDPHGAVINWDYLARANTEELERLYAMPRDVSVPRGIFAGYHLCWLNTAAAHHPILRPVEELFFHRLRWYVDFDRRCWFWFSKKLPVGHFTPSVGASRWRETETIRLLYDDRRLPNLVNQWLYDEVKPLSEDTCLGIGGISAGPGRGEQFLFGLARLR